MTKLQRNVGAATEGSALVCSVFMCNGTFPTLGLATGLLVCVCVCVCVCIYIKVKKGKAIPLEAWTGPEGSSRLRLPDFKTIGT